MQSGNSDPVLFIVQSPGTDICLCFGDELSLSVDVFFPCGESFLLCHSLRLLKKEVTS